MEQALQMLDFSSGKLDIQLLDSVVCRFYDGNGTEVSTLLATCPNCEHEHRKLFTCDHFHNSCASLY